MSKQLQTKRAAPPGAALFVFLGALTPSLFPMPNKPSVTTPISPQNAPASNATATIAPAVPTPKKPPYPTVDQILQVCKHFDKQNVAKYLPYVLKAMCAGGLTSKNHLIGIVATIAVETDYKFAPIEEYGDGSISNPSGGTKYKGRGFIMLTHDYNYKKFSQDSGVGDQYLSNPSALLDPEISAKGLVWFWLGKSGNNPSRSAASADWIGVRKAVNGGTNGMDKYMPVIDAGIKVFTQDLDPAAIGQLPLDGSYGLNCVDPGSGSSRTLAGMHNPSTQADALSYALGLHNSDRAKSHTFRAILLAAAHPPLLKLDVQKTFEGKGFGVDLDGEYTVEEIFIYPLEPGIEMEVFAHKPDPNAPKPQVFLHDTTQGLGPEQARIAPGSAVPASEINRKIAESAKAYVGTNTSAGPGGGNVACAWAVNNILYRAIGHTIPPQAINTPGPKDDCHAVRDALKGGYGQELSGPSDAKDGDIAFFSSYGHIGIVLNGKIYSNSSSKSTWTWGSDIQTFGGNGPPHFFRVTK